MKTEMGTTRRSGFTLIELLVVIAIIAILASILFPVFSRAREAARKISCLNNMRQSATAVQQYVQDYDEQFPMSVYLSSNAAGPCAFTMLAAIEPYIKNTQVYQCPSEPRALDIDTPFVGFGLTGGECGQFQYVSHMFNFAVFEDGDLPPLLTAVRPIHLSELNYPTETTMNYDANLAAQSDCGFDTFDSPTQGRHNGVAVASFVDGHSKIVKVAESGCVGANLNGKPIRQYCVSQEGPYRRRCGNPAPAACYDELWGIAENDALGWCAKALR